MAPPCRAAEKRVDETSQVAYLEAAVPSDQRPVNELKQLKDDLLYSWVRECIPLHAECRPQALITVCAARVRSS